MPAEVGDAADILIREVTDRTDSAIAGFGEMQSGAYFAPETLISAQHIPRLLSGDGQTGTRRNFLVVAEANGRVIAESTNSLTLREANYPPVPYVPLADLDQSTLTPTDTQTYCPFKGDASYYTVATPDGELVDGIWTYSQPYEAVAEIAGHVAFYPDRFEVTVGA